MSYSKSPKAPISLIIKREREERSLEQSHEYEHRMYLQKKDYPTRATNKKSKQKSRGCETVDFTI